MNKINVLSLFDGMSVAQQALKELKIPVGKYYASEVDPYAIAVTQSNFPETIQLGDIIKIKGIDFPAVDLIIGGSPCQDLSISKKNREGLKGEKSKLFYEFVRLIKEVKPKYFVLENVASMAKDQKAIMESELFGIEAVVINASLVSAQNRKRIFIVGERDGDSYNKVEIPQPEDRGILLKDILEKEVDEKYYIKNVNLIKGGTDKKTDLDFLGGIRNKDWAKDGKNYSRNFAQGDRVYSLEGKSVTLSANGGGRGAKTGLYEVSGAASRTYPRIKVEGQTRSKQIEIRDDGKANAMTSVQGDSMVAMIPNKSKTIRTGGRGSGFGDKHNWDMVNQIRRLTPTECLRLQSMPDSYFDKAIYKNKPISNTQRYKMCGNAFNCEVIKHILKTIFYS